MVLIHLDTYRLLKLDLGLGCDVLNRLDLILQYPNLVLVLSDCTDVLGLHVLETGSLQMKIMVALGSYLLVAIPCGTLQQFDVKGVYGLPFDVQLLLEVIQPGSQLLD